MKKATNIKAFKKKLFDEYLVAFIKGNMKKENTDV